MRDEIKCLESSLRCKIAHANNARSLINLSRRHNAINSRSSRFANAAAAKCYELDFAHSGCAADIDAWLLSDDDLSSFLIYSKLRYAIEALCNVNLNVISPNWISQRGSLFLGMGATPADSCTSCRCFIVSSWFIDILLKLRHSKLVA